DQAVLVGLPPGEKLMLDLTSANFKHALCALILISRIGDLGTTYLVTPTLKLEANPLARKLGWRFAILTLAVCFIPYYSVNMAVMILVPCLMVSAGNAGRIWAAKTMGEERYRAMLLSLAVKSRLRHALAGVLLSAFFIILLGLVLVWLYSDPSEDLAYWFGAGIVTYGLVMGLHGSLWFIRLFKQAAATSTGMMGDDPR